MAKKYVFVRMPAEVYNIYKDIKIKMENDLKKTSGRDIPLTMPKVFKAVASPQFNENLIVVDLNKLRDLARRKK